MEGRRPTAQGHDAPCMAVMQVGGKCNALNEWFILIKDGKHVCIVIRPHFLYIGLNIICLDSMTTRPVSDEFGILQPA